VFSIKEILEYPQLAARRFWTEVNHTELDTVITYPGALFKSNEAQPEIACRAPLIGEHNKDIYGMELGLSNQEMTALKQANII
jgi:crotonobetainyl-CoA:carnitine CoA-transferase CaiB-like acyl-CoA transferase